MVFLAGRADGWEGVSPGHVGVNENRDAVSVAPDGPLASITPGALRVAKWGAISIDTDKRWKALAEVGGRPLALAGVGEPLVLVNSYPGRKKADVVRHRVFVPFLQALVSDLAGTGADRVEARQVHTGEVHRPPSDSVVTGPRGTRYELKGGEEFRFEEPGVFRMARIAEEGREEVEFVGVNVGPPAASTAGGMPIEAVFSVKRETARETSQLDESGRSGPWRLIALGLLLLLCTELILGALPVVRGRR
jgi:hypothetical protein